ncbi:endopeptidase La [Psittacicella hinzii]|uniref:endopeptidase La n=1 Tax=Psittacicella hinzii TaxID=2028575 RepID=A0A3A1YQ84_9GAMM|nr:endopeptidase La [Psittacicella hinzii]RIY39368.1 endopeptidase La [Psittacicella hinzii]
MQKEQYEYGQLPVIFVSGNSLYASLYNDEVLNERVYSEVTYLNLDKKSQVDTVSFLTTETVPSEADITEYFGLTDDALPDISVSGEYKPVLVVTVDNDSIPATFQGFRKKISSYSQQLVKEGFLCIIRKTSVAEDGVTANMSIFPIAEAQFDFYDSEVKTFNNDIGTGHVLLAKVKSLPFTANFMSDDDRLSNDVKVTPRAKEFALTKLRNSVSAYMQAIDNKGLFSEVEFKSLPTKYSTYVYQCLSFLNVNPFIVSNFARTPYLYQRYEFLISHVELLLNRKTFDAELQDSVRKNMETAQRKYYITEQIRALKRELNPDGASDESDVEKLLQELDALNIEKYHPELFDKISGEIRRLEMIPSNSQEYYMQQNYVDWLLKTPYKGDTLGKIDLAKSRAILDSDHFGLDDVKERILEYLAVLSRVDLAKSPVLCLIGPPGVGKTSLGRSIAEATGRKYTRWALGGLSDEAEIRGHRRTYIGSQPGKVISHLSKVGVNNPLFLLDEIDKLTSNHRGDPAAALLEVLDPEQNNKFVDNYLEVDYDLSKVLFIATANSYNIPPALLDRMEIVDLGSYTRNEKFQIAKKHILPKLLKRNAVEETEIDFPDKMINFIIDGYTNEPGVRSLERRIERIIRYTIKLIVESKVDKVVVDSELVQKVLGPVINESNVEQTEFRAKSFVGQITGLAWTQAGGDVLPIEAAVTSGKGNISATGSLGDQIKESIKAAITVIRQRYKQFDLPEDFYVNNDFHVHFPNAGISKDGPSAGSAITTCLISALTKKPIAMDIGMTGEISLHGDVLRIGGVKEKVISAHRNGVKHIILPKSNEPDLYKVPQSIKDELQFYPVETIDEVIDIVFGDKKRPAKTLAAEADLDQYTEKAKKATRTKKAKAEASTETVEVEQKKAPKRIRAKKVVEKDSDTKEAESKTTTKAKKKTKSTEK